MVNPVTLYYALNSEAQQLIGRNATSTEEESFARWYAGQELQAADAVPEIEPPTPQAAAYQWLYTNDRIEIAANEYLNAANAVNCMIKNDGPCPDTTTTTWP